MNIIDATDQKKWDKFVTSHADANFLQSWAWGDFHEARGKKVVRRIALDKDDNIVGAYVGQIETARRGTYMAIAGGPILDWGKKALREAIKSMREKLDAMEEMIDRAETEADEYDEETAEDRYETYWA